MNMSTGKCCAAVLVSLAAVTAVTGAQARGTASAEARQAAAGPPAAFEALVQQCREAFIARPMTEVAYTRSNDAWVKRSFAPAEIRASVQATPSPVSPFVARITVVELASAQPGPDFDSTRALDVPMDRNLLRSERSLHFAYQEGRWTLLSLAVRLQVKADPTVPFETVRTARLEPQAVRLLDGPIAACAAVAD